MRAVSKIFQSVPITLLALFLINFLFLIFFYLWHFEKTLVGNASLLLPLIYVLILFELVASLVGGKPAWLRSTVFICCILLWSAVALSALKDTLQRKDLFNRFLTNNFDKAEYCKLTYSEKLKLESMSTYGIIDCDE